MKVITVLKGTCPAKRIEDAKILGLPYLWEKAINDIINEYKMTHEAWIESASDAEKLRSNLKNRGYSQLNDSLLPMINLSELPIAEIKNAKHYRLGTQPPEANHIALKKLKR